MKRLRQLISIHMLLLGAIYVADGMLLQNVAYTRQGGLMPLLWYGVVFLVVGFLFLIGRHPILFAAVSAVYVALALSFWPVPTAIGTYLWMAVLVTVIGRMDHGD